MGGCALVAVAGRRFAASWRPSAESRPIGLVDLRIGHDRTGGAVSATLVLGRDVSNPEAHFARTLDVLAKMR
jgi:hypothetical protein